MLFFSKSVGTILFNCALFAILWLKPAYALQTTLWGESKDGQNITIKQLDIAASSNKLSASKAATGTLPWLSLMCKFPDISAEPKNKAYFQAMYADSFPGLNHYWKAVSYNQLNLQGSTASGWHTLPNNRSFYIPGGKLNHNAIAQDCVNAAASSIDVRSFYGINFMFNAELDGNIWGGAVTLDLNGSRVLTPSTWIPDWGYENISNVAHEMGHGFGLDHSSGEYGETYDNGWDVMSGMNIGCFNSNKDAAYGCIGQHPIAEHKNRLGWIAPQRMRSVVGEVNNITLDNLSTGTGNQALMVKIPITDQHYYTVEVRENLAQNTNGEPSYDRKLPGKAVLIHEVDRSRKEPAHIKDADNNGYNGDAGAMWIAGETFNDPKHNISITINSETASGYIVSVDASLQIPSKPSALAASEGTYSNRVELNWAATSAASEYKVYQCSSFSEQTCFAPTTVSDNRFADYSVVLNQYYFYRIKACNTVGCSDFSSYALGYILASGTSLAAPASISASDGTYADRIVIDWSAVSAANRYELYRCSNNSENSCVLNHQTTGIQHQDTNAETDITYYYRVKACNDSACSTFSQANSGYQAAIAPATPNKPVASDGTSSSLISINWDAVDTATSYQVFICTATTTSSCDNPIITSDNTATDFNAMVDVMYYYRVKACNGSSCSAYSAYDSGHLQVIQPTEAARPNASDGSYADKVALSWQANNLAANYDVYRCIDSNIDTCAKLASVSSFSFNDLTAVNQQHYDYRITACNSLGCSPLSDADSGHRTIITPPGPPQLSTTLNGYRDRIIINWNAIQAATNYEILRCTLFTLDTCSTIATVSTNSYTDTNISANNYYFYRAKACNSAGCSAASQLLFGRADSNAPPIIAPAPPPKPIIRSTTINAILSVILD